MFAERLLSSKTQTYAIVCGLALLSLFFKPLGILTSAAVTLIALGVNLTSALLLGMVSTSVIALVSFALDSSVMLDVTIYVGMYMLPAILGCALLRHQMGLHSALLGIGLWVGLSVILARLWYGDLNEIWLTQLQALIKELAIDNSQIDLDILKVLITASMAFVVFLLSCLGLILGCKWSLGQKLIFQKMTFHQLKYGPKVALLMTIIGLIAFLNNQIALDISGIILGLLLLQGLALFHYLLYAKTLSSLWAIPLYMVILLVPETFFLVTTIGLIDNWIHLRKYVPMQA